MKKIYSIYIFTGLVLAVTSLYAHGSGASFEKVVGEYLVDVGYEPAEIVEGDSQRFDFNVYKESNKEEVSFSDVWVNISSDGKTVLATGVHKPEFGPTGVTIVFPESGNYVLNVRFQNNGETIAEATLPFTVLESKSAEKSESDFSPYYTLFGGFILGSLIFYFLGRGRNS